MKNNQKLTYFLLRVIIGVSMFGHGLVRLPKIEAFSNGMVDKFQTTIIPEMLVEPFGYVLTVAEFILGLLLILGLLTKQVLVASILTMTVLVFGSTAMENWPVIDSQLIHAIMFAFLLWNLDYNAWSLDSRKKFKK